MTLLRCPVCHENLSKHDRQYRCLNAHTFDCAKEGYINLLLSHKKKSKQPGDNKAMLSSRKRFLEKGYFSKLLDALCFTIKNMNNSSSLCALDLGCGEGYFLRSIGARLGSFQELWGIDVSKAAIQMAAKCDSASQYLVASSNELPFNDQAFDVAYSINAPVYEIELRRVLKNGGSYIRISPADNHLWALKKIIYNEPRSHSSEILRFDTLFHVERQKIGFEIDLRGNDIYDLLLMTPYYWHTSEERQNYIKDLKLLSTPALFNLDVYQAE